MITEAHTSDSIADIMQEHYSDVHSVMSLNPPLIGRKLYSAKFIDFHTLSVVTGTQNSMTDAAKADTLVQATQLFILTHEDPREMLIKLLEILDGAEPIGPNVAKAIREVSHSPTHCHDVT